MHDTTKKRGHRLPSSSDEKENGRPRKVSRPAALSSDSEDHLITSSQIREGQQAPEESEGEGEEEEDREASEEGSEDAAEDNEEQAEESQSDVDEDDEDQDEESPDDEGLDDFFSQEEDDDQDEYNSDSQPSNIGHRIDAYHIAQLAATILWRLPSEGSEAVTGAKYSYQSNLTFCDNTPAGRLLRFQRWRELVWQETHPGEEGDEEEESVFHSGSDEVSRSGPPSEVSPSEPGEIWNGGSWLAWFQWENEWDASWTSQAGRATLEDESLRPPYGDGSRYVLVGAAAEEPIQGRRNDARRRQRLMEEDGPEENVESGAPAAEVGGQTDGAADDHEHNVGDEVNGMPWVEYNDTWSGLGEAEDEDVDGRTNGAAENAIENDSQPAQPPVVPHRTLILTPAGGLPGPPYTGPTTRRRALENGIRNTPLEPGQEYVYIPIAESQAAQMLLGLYGGEPDGEDGEDGNDEGS